MLSEPDTCSRKPTHALRRAARGSGCLPPPSARQPEAVVVTQVSRPLLRGDGVGVLLLASPLTSASDFTPEQQCHLNKDIRQVY
jgi:hypothetical protein